MADNSFGIQLRVDIAGSHVEYDSNGVPFTQYRIRIIQHELNPKFVYRRYRDFEHLHGQLLKDSSLTNVPAIPPKKYLANLSTSFVEKRKQNLEEYLQRLIGITGMAQQADFVDFVNPKSQIYKRLSGFDVGEANSDRMDSKYSLDVLNGIYKSTVQKRPLGHLSREDVHILCRTSLQITDNIFITKLFNGLEIDNSSCIQIRDLVCSLGIILLPTYPEKIEFCCGIYNQLGQLSRNDVFSMMHSIKVICGSPSPMKAEELGEEAHSIKSLLRAHIFVFADIRRYGGVLIPCCARKSASTRPFSVEGNHDEQMIRITQNPPH